MSSLCLYEYGQSCFWLYGLGVMYCFKVFSLAMCIVGNVKLQSERYVLQVGGEDDGLPDLIPQTNIKVEDDESDSIDKFFQQVSLRWR